ncbi:MAG: hypothetical protein RBS13_07890, partial [Bacteroidales bacterium]|nr:hypothetical protein [Bacteroidales bacterium]
RGVELQPVIPLATSKLGREMPNKSVEVTSIRCAHDFLLSQPSLVSVAQNHVIPENSNAA